MVPRDTTLITRSFVSGDWSRPPTRSRPTRGARRGRDVRWRVMDAGQPGLLEPGLFLFLRHCDRSVPPPVVLSRPWVGSPAEWWRPLIMWTAPAHTDRGDAGTYTHQYRDLASAGGTTARRDC